MVAAASRRNTNPERCREINVSTQDRNLIFQFSRGTRAEEFSATRIEQHYLVTPPPSLRKHPSYPLRNDLSGKGIKIYFCKGLLTAGCAGENLSTSCASSSPGKSGVFACRAQTLALSG